LPPPPNASGIVACYRISRRTDAALRAVALPGEQGVQKILLRRAEGGERGALVFHISALRGSVQRLPWRGSPVVARCRGRGGYCHGASAGAGRQAPLPRKIVNHATERKPRRDHCFYGGERALKPKERAGHDEAALGHWPEAASIADMV
jgi:hypothetical protein